MLVERLEAVDAAPFVDEMAHRPIGLVVILHVGDPVIFGQCSLQALVERFIRRVADAQHRGAGLFQPVAEIRARRRKMRREENEIHGYPPGSMRRLRHNLPFGVARKGQWVQSAVMEESGVR